jgi:hypothetical protein
MSNTLRETPMQMKAVIAVRLPEQTLVRLKAIARRRSLNSGKNVSVSSLIRRAVDRLVGREEEEGQPSGPG